MGFFQTNDPLAAAINWRRETGELFLRFRLPVQAGLSFGSQKEFASFAPQSHFLCHFKAI
jgi:hypothetical protein